jgi:hypothetical protein
LTERQLSAFDSPKAAFPESAKSRPSLSPLPSQDLELGDLVRLSCASLLDGRRGAVLVQGRRSPPQSALGRWHDGRAWDAHAQKKAAAPGSDGGPFDSRYAKLTDLRRARMAPPMKPKPPSIIAALAGSGAALMRKAYLR